MIELKHDRLNFFFPDVHPEAKLSVEFQRTLRIPCDDQTYPLPPALGSFPLRHVDDFAASVPAKWLQHGGVMMPMFQSEAMWINFDTISVRRRGSYPFAIKIATGKTCAVSGEAWSDGLYRKPQNYVVAPEQPWLDGYVVEKGLIRQFVAMPLGNGYTAEEQISGAAEHGGLQISVYPMKREVFERRFSDSRLDSGAMMMNYVACSMDTARCDMGLAPGGRMRQEVYDDPFDPKDWQLDANSRCFVHLCNSMVWQSIAESAPPHPAPTAKHYSNAGLPWFDYYDEDAKPMQATDKLAGLKSMKELSDEKGDVVLPENESVTPEKVIVYRKGLKKNQVRESLLL